MLAHWLKPADSIEEKEDGCIANLISVTPAELSKTSSCIYLISDNSVFANSAKTAFYRLQNHFNDLIINDLGSLKNDNPEFVISLLRELIPMNGRIIVLSNENSYLDSAFRALEYATKNITLALINSNLDILKENRTARSLSSENLLNLSAVGYQRHFCPQDLLSYIHESFVHHVSYGQARSNIQRVEPILRNVNACTLALDVIKSPKMPNGFDALEICQIAKYAGMSSSMKILNIANTIGADIDSVTPLVGQILWYFTEGHSLREQSPKGKDVSYFQEHLVQTDYSNYSFTFWKSTKTNRWWFEIPSTDGERGNIYPCNKEDYELACRNEISEYLLNQMNLDH